MMLTTRRLGLRALAAVLGFGLAAGTALRADPIVDPANDLRQPDAGDPNAYAGPPIPSLDVLSANVILNLADQTLTFTSTMNGPIADLVNSSGGNLGTFSWGINHGYGNLNFASIGLPGVIFDAVLAVNPNGTAAYRGEQAPAGSVTASGNTLTAVLPLAFLAPPPPPVNAQGPLLDVRLWQYNLWPRSNVRPDGSTIPFGNAQIADFAPDNAVFTAQVVPEPSSVVLIGTGLLGAVLCGLIHRARRCRAAVVPVWQAVTRTP